MILLLSTNPTSFITALWPQTSAGQTAVEKLN